MLAPCPKCTGTLYVDHDGYGKVLVCRNCGWDYVLPADPYPEHKGVVVGANPSDNTEYGECEFCGGRTRDLLATQCAQCRVKEQRARNRKPPVICPCGSRARQGDKCFHCRRQERRETATPGEYILGKDIGAEQSRSMYFTIVCPSCRRRTFKQAKYGEVEPYKLCTACR